MTPDETTAAGLIDRVEAIRLREPRISPLAAGIVAALSMDIASDSSSFAKTFGIAHALVLREISLMAGPEALVSILSRDARTQRTHLALSASGIALVAAIAAKT